MSHCGNQLYSDCGKIHRQKRLQVSLRIYHQLFFPYLTVLAVSPNVSIRALRSQSIRKCIHQPSPRDNRQRRRRRTTNVTDMLMTIDRG
ncbi:hypothetical protein L596_001735 [Steinernema carpocapsae]|uniref:Uncharacterized protein n=1 Tax=Steinernema carpocapsae TaxID=34508 RepID=A0A4V6I7H6_STECR|nr:hypothetical protein L596_001735 [Steinernema carpocapsae]